MDYLRIAIEFIPVILAIIAIPTIVNARSLGRDPKLVWSTAGACVILIIAQTGWIQAILTNNTIALTVFDYTWTLFNCMVMIIFIRLFKRSRE